MQNRISRQWLRHYPVLYPAPYSFWGSRGVSTKVPHRPRFLVAQYSHLGPILPSNLVLGIVAEWVADERRVNHG